MVFFNKRRFCSHRPVRPLRALSPKGPMESKTAIFEMKPLTALLAGGSQNGIFQKTPILPTQSRKAVQTLMAKRVNWVENSLFGNEALNGLTGRRESKWYFQQTPFLLPQASQAVESLIAKRADGVQNGHF